MALKTDDCDLRNVQMFTFLGGNGDFHLTLVEFPIDDVLTSSEEFKSVNMRISTSGGNAPTDVKIAIANLFRAMEKHGLNEYPEE